MKKLLSVLFSVAFLLVFVSLFSQQSFAITGFSSGRLVQTPELDMDTYPEQSKP